MFDLTKSASFEGVLRWFKQITEAKDCPIIIVGNKYDLKSMIILSDDEMREIADYCKVPCFQASAETSEGVDEAFMSMIQMSYARYVTKQTMTKHL